jgi:hypothetical protein
LAYAHHVAEVSHLVHAIADVFRNLEDARVVLPVGVLRRLVCLRLGFLSRSNLVGREHACHRMAWNRGNLLRDPALRVLIRLSGAAARHDRHRPDIAHALLRQRVYEPLVIGRVCDSYHLRLVDMRVTS